MQGVKYGLLFGLNYNNEPSAKLRGCINDVQNVKQFLIDVKQFNHIDLYSDDVPSSERKTTGYHIIHEIEKLAIKTHEKEIDMVWIHFSGHGCSVRDWSGDEMDGTDECIVPSDFRTNGVVKDDTIKNALLKFNKRTKVIMFFDCCHSGTIADLRYKYNDDNSCRVDNKTQCDANVIMISGCKDTQTSADAFNVMNQRMFTGAMTSCILNVFRTQRDMSVFSVVSKLREELKTKRFSQIPQLSSSHMLENTTNLFLD